MGAALLGLRLVLACVFLVAGAAKLADLPGSRRAVVGFGVPERFAGVVGVGLPVCELAVAVALVLSVSARFGALGAVVLLGVFVAGISVALARGSEADCHCFGQVHSAPVGWSTLARNLLLAGMAGFVVLEGWRHPGVSATHWVTRVPAAWLVAICAGLVIVALVGFQVWFSLQLLSQNGRTLGRLEALEGTLEEVIGALGLAENGAAADPGPLGYGLDGGGLPVGSRAPAFEVADVDGERRSLASLLSGGRRLMLVFSDAGCGPCDALMPQLAGWQREHAGQLELGVIASGDRARNRVKASEHGLELVLLQSEREVSDAYQAHGTPMAVVINPDGLIASPTVGGTEAIRTLVARAARQGLAVRHGPSSNGHQNGAAPRAAPPPPDSSRVGQAAPELVLPDLDGGRVELKDLYRERTVAIFWNPGCGFCQRMLADLKAFEDDPPPGAPRPVVISSGDVDRVREQEIRSTVLLDTESEAPGAFGAGGTPMGVLIDEGRIASPVAAGADAVFALIRSSIAEEGAVR
jgi:thiol-disulfide isomerase/thioredoxin/uncharacterized membrane protein YphA (DoxX/SURF4 family)